MLITAFIMGIAGSLHCAGMCSPLAMAVTRGNSKAFANRFLYNLGRIITYGVLGAVVASLGYLLPFSGFQNLLSVILGVLLLIMAVFGVTAPRLAFVTHGTLKFTAFIKRLFSRFIQRKNAGAMLLLGALNGVLPCGLTFLALSFCLTLSSPLEGFSYMLAFGSGTLPVMLGFVSVIGFIVNRTHWNFKTVTAGVMILSGLLLIARVFIIHLPESHQHAGLVDIIICR